MDKLLYFGHKNQFGEQVITPITANYTSSLTKVAAELVPEVRDYIANLKPEPGKTYALVNALGAGEYWSGNSNGDFFSEAELLENYPTFLQAHPYEHHVNKDPKKALGKVEIAAWNSVMHRVELVLSIDNSKAPGIVRRIEEGGFPAVSMGAKVPYDICNYCGHQSKHIAEYCEHLKTRMNEILPDGRKIYAINPKPKFFDISFVLIGADKTASVLKKVASADVCAAPEFMTLSAKLAADSKALEPKKTAAEIKRADIYKNVPTETMGVIEESGAILDKDILPALETSEPRFPKEALDKLAQFELSEILSTLTFSGIILKPEEYQRIALVKTGRAKLADALEQVNIVFSIPDEAPTDMDDLIKISSFSDKAFEAIYPHLGDRCAFSPHIEARLEKLASQAKLGYIPPVIPIPVDVARREGQGKELGFTSDLLKLLAMLGLGYGMYRNTVPQADFSKLDILLAEHPKTTAALLAGVAGSLALGLSEARTVSKDSPLITKHAGFIERVVTPFAGAYLGSAYLQGKRNKGYRLNRLESFLADNPMLVGGAGTYLGLKTYLNPKVKDFVAEGVKKVAHSLEPKGPTEKRASFAGDVFTPFASGWFKPTLPNLVGNAVDLAAIAGIIKGIQHVAERKQKQEASKVLQQIARTEGLRDFSFKPNNA